eukprot:2648823-Rhodomonas_salina.1
MTDDGDNDGDDDTSTSSRPSCFQTRPLVRVRSCAGHMITIGGFPRWKWYPPPLRICSVEHETEREKYGHQDRETRREQANEREREREREMSERERDSKKTEREMIGTTKVGTGLDIRDLAPSDSYWTVFVNQDVKYFREQGPAFELVFPPGSIDWTAAEMPAMYCRRPMMPLRGVRCPHIAYEALYFQCGAPYSQSARICTRSEQKQWNY